MRLGLWLLPSMALAIVGCELFAGADRDRIPGPGGGGGQGGSTSSSSSGTTGTLECVLPIDCPGSDADCEVRTCTAGGCGRAALPLGTPTANQLAGDCLRAVCDGKGAETMIVDDDDTPDDADPCTRDLCTGGEAANPPIGAGAPCGDGWVCNGAGACVACVAKADCPSGKDCVSNVCQ